MYRATLRNVSNSNSTTFTISPTELGPPKRFTLSADSFQIRGSHARQKVIQHQFLFNISELFLGRKLEREKIIRFSLLFLFFCREEVRWEWRTAMEEMVLSVVTDVIIAVVLEELTFFPAI